MFMWLDADWNIYAFLKGYQVSYHRKMKAEMCEFQAQCTNGQTACLLHLAMLMDQLKQIFC